MKKIIALFLSVVCVIGLVSCGGGATTTPPKEDPLKVFTEALSLADPKSATIETSLESQSFGVTLEGVYEITYNEDGTATVAYEYDQLLEINDDTPDDAELVYQVEGSATIAQNGAVSGDVSDQVAAVAGVKLNIDASKMTYTVSSGLLSATVKAADTAAILGAAISYDVSFTLSLTAEGAVSAITVSYTSAQGPVEIVCLYNY